MVTCNHRHIYYMSMLMLSYQFRSPKRYRDENLLKKNIHTILIIYY